jgi:type IV pilus assembly protein PilV
VRLGCTRRDLARGFTLIEILIALFMLAFGMLALARVTGRSAQEEVEAYQRSQAMTIALEMADRITNNSKQAALYVEEYAPVGPAEDCAALPDPTDLVAHDKCEWRNRLRGVDIIASGKGIGSPIAAMGCVINTAPNVYTVAVAWQGLVPTAAADSPCGDGQLGAENLGLRRVFSTVFQIATLGA